MSRFGLAGRLPEIRFLRVLVAVALLAAPLMVFRALPAAAAFTSSYVMDGAPDFNPSSATDAVQSATDSSYAGEGSQERDICPTTDFDTIPDNKADLHKVWIDNDGDHLYLAWSRINTNGTAAVTFELNQSDVACGNGVQNVRTEGDLLIAYNFQGNSVDDEIEVGYRTWIGGATTGEWSGPHDVVLDADEATSAISADFTFGELEIDLTAAGIFSADECVNFASVFVKSRASSEGFNSKLKDVTPPASASVTNCAYVRVVKNATPDGSTSFPFTFAKSGAQTSTGFNLVDDGDATTPGHSWLSPGLLDVDANYLVTETPPDPTPGKWALTSASCTGAESFSFNAATGQITVKPGGPVEVVCTFNNDFDPPPTVSVTKTANVTSMNEPGGAVTFTVSVWNTSNEPVTVTTLTDTVGQSVVNLLTLADNNTCDTVGRNLTASNGSRGGTDTMECTFTINVTGNAGLVHNDRVDAILTDAENDTATSHDTETVTLVNVLPTVDVLKTASVNSMPEPGGPVTFTVSVWNTSNEGVTVTSLSDTVGQSVVNLLTLADNNTCDTIGRVLTASNGSRGGSDTMECAFTVNVTGNAGFAHNNRVDGIVTDDDQTTATDFDTETVTLTNVLPTVDVLKTANVTTLNEPGGPVTFTVSVWNTSNEGVTVTSLTDTVGQSVVNLLTLADNNTCDTIGRVLTASNGSRGGSDTMECTFTVNVTGNAGFVHNNRVDGIVTDDDQTTATDFDTETVTLLNVLPTVDVTKTASVSTMPEPGGPVTYTVSVWNTSNEPVTVTSLTDTVGQSVVNLLTLADSNTCDTVGRNLTASNGSRGGTDTMECTFTINVTGNAGFAHNNRVDGIVTDDDQTTATDWDDETVTLTNVLPTVDVLKTASVSSMPEPGGPVTFTVSVWNTSNEGVTVTSLSDTVGQSVVNLLTLADNNTCDTIGRVLTASNGSRGGSDTMECAFTVNVSGNAGFAHNNRVDGIVTDDDQTTATDFDTETVTLTNVLPTVDVTKTADVDSLLEPGGPVTYTVSVWNTSNEGVTVTSLTDTVGAAVANLLTLADNNTCDTIGRVLTASNGSRGGSDTMECTFTINVAGNAGDTHDNRVDGVVTDDDQTTATDFDTETVTVLNVLPTVDVTKTANVTTVNEPGGPVTYTVSVWNLSDEGVTVTSLTDTVGQAVSDLLATADNSDCDTANRVLTASDGERGGSDTMTCTFTINVTGNAGFVHNNRVDGVVTDDDETTATDFDTEVVTVLNVLPTVNVTKTANPTSVSELGGAVTFTVTVQNTSIEPVTLTSLVDNVFGNLNGRGTCATGGVIAVGATYSCTFTATLTGQPSTPHRNVVDGTVTDDEGSTAKDDDDAEVSFIDVLPKINVEKSPSAPVIRTGSSVTYTYVVTNTGSEPLANVKIGDNKCTSISFAGGDTDGDKLLDTSETWTYSCTQALTVDTTNVVTVSGEDDDGNTTSDTDDAVVKVIDPVIAIDKVSDVTSASPGETVRYGYTVTNPGNDPLSNITLTDDKCSPVTQTGGDTDGDGKLDPGEAWLYTCDDLVEAAGQLTNIAVVTGTPTVGPNVSAQDTVSIPVVLGEVLVRPELPRTGGFILRLLSMSLVLLVAGSVLLVAVNRRRRASA